MYAGSNAQPRGHQMWCAISKYVQARVQDNTENMSEPTLNYLKLIMHQTINTTHSHNGEKQTEPHQDKTKSDRPHASVYIRI